MNRTNRILPTYAGDVSGACSALFELGGMVVIHDPSGCNSTYNTHDETRWYDRDSLIFITGLIERDAILGNDQKLVRDVVDAALELRPRFVALCNSPIPFITGTDFRALCRIIERQTHIPCFYVRTNGMHDYAVGAGGAFVALAERFVERRPTRLGALNILGATPLDLGIAGSDTSLRGFADWAGFEVTSCWAMGSTLDELARAAEAEVNLVVSATGLPVARWMQERFGTPYVVGMPLAGGRPKTSRTSGGHSPLGTFRAPDVPKGENPPEVHGWPRALAEALRTAARTHECAWPCLRREASPTSESCCLLVGEPVAMGSLAAALSFAYAGDLRVMCPLEVPRELLAQTDLLVEGEEDIQNVLLEAQAQTDKLCVVADALYKPVVPEGAQFLQLAHQAFSGRNSWGSAVDLALLDPRDLSNV